MAINPDRFEDHEILFTTLILMCGEPPQLAKNPPTPHSLPDAPMAFAHDMKAYGQDVKMWMGEFGHNAHQGLFTEYMHWAREQWNG